MWREFRDAPAAIPSPFGGCRPDAVGMHSRLDLWMNIANAAQSVVPLISLIAYIPQWRRLLRTRNSHSISLASWATWAVSYTIAVFYSTTLLLVTGRGWPLVVTTTLGLCFVLFTMALVWRFRPLPR